MTAPRLEMNLLIVALDGAIPAEVPAAEVLVVAPALNSWLRRWLSDEDAARRQAEGRVAAWVEGLERRGVHAAGRVGDADPLQAIADALATFPADEVVIAAQAESSVRLAGELVLRARDRFTLPTFRVGIGSVESHEARDPRGDRRPGLRQLRRRLIAFHVIASDVDGLEASGLRRGARP